MKSAVTWLLAEKTLRLASAVLVAAAVARHLGPQAYGVLAVAIGFMSIPTQAAGMGADHLNQSLLAGQRDSGTLYAAFAVRLAWALCCAGLALGAASALQASPLGAYAALAAGVCVVAAAIFTHALYAQGRFRLASVLGLCALAAGAAARLVGIHADWGVDGFAWCVALEIGLPMLLAAAVVSLGRNPQPRTGWSWSAARDYLRLCAPTTLSAVLVALYFRLELFIVDWQLGKESAGTWAAAMMFVTPWSMVAAAVLPVASRELARVAGQEAAYRSAMTRLLRRMFGLAGAAIAVNLLAIELVVPHLLGPAFEAAVRVGWISSLVILPLFMGAAQELWLARQRRTGVVLRKVLYGLPLSALLAWAGASHFGLAGAAAAMVVSYLFTAIALNAVVDREFLGLQRDALWPFGRTLDER